MSRNPITILGVRIDPLTMDEAAQKIITQAQSKAPSVYVVKPYVEFLDRTATDPQSLQLLNNAWLSLPDAISVQWAAAYLYEGRPSWWRVMALGAQIIFRPKRLTRTVPEKFSGATFTWKLLELCAAYNLSVFLIGSPKGGSIENTRAAIANRLPQLRIVGTAAGSIDGFSGNALKDALTSTDIEIELATDIKKSRADITLVGMGFPLQEQLMAKLTRHLTHGVLIGEGGTFDYTSFGGKRPKAPRFIQAIGLEWLWRLLLEPARIVRQLAIPRFIWAVYRTSKQR